MVFDPLVILRVVTVAPDAVPALRPVLYGVVEVQVAVTVLVASTLLVRTPADPKFKFVALIEQFVTTVAVTVNEKFAVLVPTEQFPPDARAP
jgi:hypothetical protein